MNFVSNHFRLERGIVMGGIFIILGIITFIYLPVSYFTHFLWRFSDPVRLDIAISAIALFFIGIQTVFSSFVLSLFYLKVK